jgi:Zn-dependent protease
MPQTVSCGGCGSPVSPRLLVCPSCHSFVHRRRLSELAAGAEGAEKREEWPQAVRHWRDALQLLPPGSKQYEAIAVRITAATPHLGQDRPQKRSGWGKLLAPLGAGAAVLWKMKFLIGGLTKIGTVLSMLAFAAVYWTHYGWPFAVALVITTYIHEMGHVAALTRLGISASAPMFIPGFGAYVRLQEYPATRAEDARVGLAGPIWGVTSGVIALALGLALPSPFFLAVAHITAVINLFNLVPVWQLDGGRGFNALTRGQRWMIVAISGAGWWAAHDFLFAIVAFAGIFRALQSDAPAEEDWSALATFAALLAVIAAVVYFAVK